MIVTSSLLLGSTTITFFVAIAIAELAAVLQLVGIEFMAAIFFLTSDVAGKTPQEGIKVKLYDGYGKQNVHNTIIA